MSEDDDDLQATSLGQPVLDDDESGDLTDTVVSGMTAFRLPPELAKAAGVTEDEADDDEKGPEDTDETLAGGDLDDDPESESEKTEP
jgi:hypothetical protein